MRRIVARFVVVAILFGACHSIDRNVFAHGPVPLSDVAFSEPVAWTVGPDAGKLVPIQNGLLATYFSGAAYIQPSWNGRLDHQQIDPNVNFSWHASDTNPVVFGPGSIDTNEGNPRLPDHWPIWSIVWEGYLAAPTDGDYGLRIHVNNGGWLEMKTPAGGLAVVIGDCAGGTSFEGECTTTRTLKAGRHYIRFSYFNNAPPSANAILSWMPPTATGFSVIPSSSLWTQQGRTASRAFMYVHGTTGDYHTPGFDGTIPPLRRHFTPERFELFQYYEDRGIPGDIGSCVPRRVPAFNTSVGYPVVIPSTRPTCDSNDGIALDGILLENDIRQLQQRTKVDKVTIMSDSGGGAIVRAYLAYAAASNSDTLAMVDGVFFIQGAQAGSYLQILDRRIAKQNPLPHDWVVSLAKKLMGHDVTRPAYNDLTPGSTVYQFTSRAAAVPDEPHYASIVGDVRVSVREKVFRWTFDRGTFPLGDGVMFPGYDDPTAMPPEGGARFLPTPTISKGKSSTQWVLTKETVLVIDYFDPYTIDRIAKVLALPETHFGIGKGLTTICVSTPEGPKILNQALLDAIVSLDGGTPDPAKLGYGNTNEAGGCK